MKKFFTLVAIAFVISSGFGQSIYNGDLEKWDSLHSATTTAYWFQPSFEGINWLGTLNSLAGLPVVTGGPGPITCEKTTDAHSGTYAAKLVSHPMNLGVITIFIPGMLGTAVMDNASVSAIIGNPCAGCKPTNLKGYYKYAPVSNDSCIIVAIVSRYNAETHKRDTLGFGYMLQREAVSEYTDFNVAINYFSSETPDTLSFLMVSSAGFNLNNFMACQGQEGSSLYIDDLTLEYPAGFEQSLMPEVGVKIFPNPASEKIHVVLDKMVDNSVMEVYGADGRIVRTVSIHDVTTTIPLSGLPSGSYFFKLKEGKNLLNSGTFVIY